MPISKLVCLSALSLSLSASTSVVPLRRELGWHLKGGMISGGYVPPQARKDWPRWMQALGGHRPASRADLEAADFWKVPDAMLPQAAELLTKQRVFTPGLLRQATAIMHAAPTRAWQQAKTAYQKAWVETKGLPVTDVPTCSRVMTQLCMEGHATTVRAALDAHPFPEDPGLRAAFRRMLNVELGIAQPTPAVVLDGNRPPVERLHALVNLRHPGEAASLVESLRGTSAFGQAAYHAVTKGWMPLDHPTVLGAMASRRTDDEGQPWFMVRPVERASDLRWMRMAMFLHQGNRAAALTMAQALLKDTPASWYAGHAAALVGQGQALRMRAPGDLTVFNASFFTSRMRPVPTDWPEAVRPLAEQGRFDLIMLQADPDGQTDLFLQAAHAAGHAELVSRYLASERRYAPETMAYAFPTFLAQYIDRLLKDEGVETLVDAAFVLAMMKNESLFQPGAVSGANAFGLLQLLRPTFRAMMGKAADIQDPETNLRAGLRYYKRISQAAGLAPLPAVVRHAYICAGYHAGEGRARRWKESAEPRLQHKTHPVETALRLEAISITSTRQYVARVLGDAEIYRALLTSSRPH